MASLGTHFAAFLLLFPTGIRRLLCSSSLYLKNPSIYRSKPFYFSPSKWNSNNNLDIFLLLFALPISSLSLFFLFLSTPSHHPSYQFSLLIQSLSLSLIWVLLILFISKESFDLFNIHEGFLFLLAAIAFLFEYYATGKGVDGLATPMYDMLGQLTLVCVVFCLVLCLKPNFFFADFLLSCSLVFKGSWCLQCGLNLFTDVFSMKGCHQMVVLAGNLSAVAKCDIDEDRFRGEALVNLLFVLHAIVVLVVAMVLFSLLSSFRSLRCGDAGGPLLSQLESDGGALARQAVSEFEV